MFFGAIRQQKDLLSASPRLEAAVEDYIQYTSVVGNYSAAAMPAEVPVGLSVDILWVWHLHMLHCRHYRADMLKAFGRVLTLGGAVDWEHDSTRPAKKGRILPCGVESGQGQTGLLEPSVDLVATAVAQSSFLEKLGPYLVCDDKITARCIKLYSKFMKLVKLCAPETLVCL
jgi:hypothetical protein